MAEATIYYNILPHPTESEFVRKLWREYYRQDNGFIINDIMLKPGQFRRYWRKLPIVESIDPNISNESNLEALFEKYNDYNTNPCTQDELKERGIRHTSMVIGDIIRIKNNYYMVAGVGFRKIRWITSTH